MLNYWKNLFAAALLSVSMFAAGAIATSVAHAQTMPLRGERGSARNIIVEKRRLEAVIDGLQRDRRDYGGHREAAIDDLQRARVELQAAIDYDATHGR